MPSTGATPVAETTGDKSDGRGALACNGHTGAPESVSPGPARVEAAG